MEEIEGMLTMKGIPKNLQDKAIEYYNYCWRKKIIFDNSANDFSSLSKNIQKEC
jgi:hypothetical protein